jgi:hypothetical protein
MKLTNAIREAVERAAVKKRFEDEDREMERRHRSLAVDVYESIPRINEIDSLPDGWVDAHEGFNAYLGGWRVALTLPEPRRMPRFVDAWKLRFPEDHEFRTRYQAIVDAETLLNLRKAELRSELKKVLLSVSTVPRLIELWPEAKDYMPQENVPAQVPAILNVNRLRELLTV